MLTDRRHVLALLAGSFATPAFAQAPAMSRITAYAFSFAGLEGGDIKLAEYAGKPILVVNTASLCGYTPQYAGLQQLWTRYHERGLMIVGVPSNDFGGQEPGGADRHHEDRARRIRRRFSAGRQGRRSRAQARMRSTDGPPVERPLETPRWNFHKYLVGRDGHIAAVFPTDIEPMDARVIDAVVKELARPE